MLRTFCILVPREILLPESRSISLPAANSRISNVCFIGAWSTKIQGSTFVSKQKLAPNHKTELRLTLISNSYMV